MLAVTRENVLGRVGNGGSTPREKKTDNMSIALPAFTRRRKPVPHAGRRALDSRLPIPSSATPWLTRSSQRSATTSPDSPN